MSPKGCVNSVIYLRVCVCVCVILVTTTITLGGINITLQKYELFMYLNLISSNINVIYPIKYFQNFINLSKDPLRVAYIS